MSLMADAGRKFTAQHPLIAGLVQLCTHRLSLPSGLQRVWQLWPRLTGGEQERRHEPDRRRRTDLPGRTKTRRV